MSPEKFVMIGDEKVLVPDTTGPDMNQPDTRGSILDERLPTRFGNRKTRRKLQSEIRKIKDV